MSTGEIVSTEVAVRVFETKPAVVNFNYQEISDRLDLVLFTYRGLVFSDSTVAECKKTIAELRKGQKSLDEFRKATKKQLTESVTLFENQCKSLYGKFDEVIQPLTLQYEQFELERREKKREEIQGIIDALISEHGLTEKYASQLLIPEEYFNKGKAIRAIKSELSSLANTLKVQRDKEAQDIDLVKTKVELANAHYQLSSALMPEPYLRLLSYKSAAEIDLLITSDAQQVSDRENKAAEALIAKMAEAPKVTETIPLEPVKAQQWVPPTASGTAPATDERITAVYEVTGTEEQLSALEAYFEANNLSWTDRSY